METITKELLNKELKGNASFANQIIDGFAKEELFEQIHYVIQACEASSNELSYFRNLLQEYKDRDAENYIQKLDNGIKFFDETRSMMHVLECSYSGLINGAKQYISKVNSEEED